MCGRYSLGDEVSAEELERIIDEANRRIRENPVEADINLKTRGEIFPTSIVPVLSAEGPLPMRWGFRRFDGKGHVINSRSEGLLEKPMFRKPAMEGRCLIPAAFYYEWETRGKQKIKHRLRPAIGGVVFMAGISRQEKNEPLPVFSIITREAAPGIAHIHDRMPVILPLAARKEWLAPNAAVHDVLEQAVREISYQPDEPTQMSLF